MTIFPAFSSPASRERMAANFTGVYFLYALKKRHVASAGLQIPHVSSGYSRSVTAADFSGRVALSDQKCTARAAAKISKENLSRDISRLIRFRMRQQKNRPARMEKEMPTQARPNFERAARLRDEIKRSPPYEIAEKREQQYWQPKPHRSIRRKASQAPGNPGLSEARESSEGIESPSPGGEMVGSKVCFIDGVPFKDAYRRYKIKPNRGTTDYLSIRKSSAGAIAKPGRATSCIPT